MASGGDLSTSSSSSASMSVSSVRKADSHDKEMTSSSSSSSSSPSSSLSDSVEPLPIVESLAVTMAKAERLTETFDDGIARIATVCEEWLLAYREKQVLEDRSRRENPAPEGSPSTRVCFATKKEYDAFRAAEAKRAAVFVRLVGVIAETARANTIALDEMEELFRSPHSTDSPLRFLYLVAVPVNIHMLTAGWKCQWNGVDKPYEMQVVIGADPKWAIAERQRLLMYCDGSKVSLSDAANRKRLANESGCYIRT